MNPNKLFLIIVLSTHSYAQDEVSSFGLDEIVVTAQKNTQYIDGIAAVIEDRIILKSDLAQMINMAAIQRQIDLSDPAVFLQVQESVIQSMVDQKILLEMAEIDSIVVEEKEVNKSLDQQVEMLIQQAGNRERAEDVLGQSIKSFRREFWYDMKDRMVTEQYQQQLLGSVVVTRSDVKDFYKTYKDSLPRLPMKVKILHLLVSAVPSDDAKKETVSFLLNLKKEIVAGASFSDFAKAHSLDPGSKNNGGELGWVSRGSLVKNFETAAFTQEVGVMSDPIETEFGYHIIETLEKLGGKIRVRHILMSPEITPADRELAFGLANAYGDSISNIDTFKEMVKKYSTDKTTIDIGGDLGWIDPANYSVPEIGQAIKYIEMGSCSPPINSSLGFHLLWVDGIKKGGRANLADHWSDVQSMALNKKKMDWYQNWIIDARGKFHTQIMESVFPQSYTQSVD